MNAARGHDRHRSLRELPECLKESVSRWLDRLDERHPRGLEPYAADAKVTGDILRLVACSEYAAETLIREWSWFCGRVLDKPLRRPDTRAKFEQLEECDVPSLQKQLRKLRNRGHLHILWREMTGAASVSETLTALSSLADNLIGAAVRFAGTELRSRFGTPVAADGRELSIVVVAMGKLGGRELNFSSDVDLIFLYPGDGETNGPRRLSAQEYFTRLVRRIVALLDEATPDGFVYRVDTRLRPFGDSGPPVISFGALEAYLLRHGRDWERYAYVKARLIGDGADAGSELMRQIVQPFVFRRYLDYGVFESLRDMKALIAAEARKRQLANNIKLGPGGIREIEFIVQSLQLVRGGSDRRLRTSRLQPALEHLKHSGSLPPAEADELARAYGFLRRVENFLQAIRDQQVHDLPAGDPDRARLAVAMRFPDWGALEAEIRRRSSAVSAQFAAVAFRGRGEDEETHGAVGEALSSLWASSAGESDWCDALCRNGYQESEAVAGVIAAFAGSGSVGQMGSTGSRRLGRFIPELLAVLQGSRQPAVVLQRVLGIVERILKRSAYLALLIENPLVLERLVGLCERSEWLADEIGRYPLLLDELLDPRLYSVRLTREDMAADLRRRLDADADADSERQIEILAEFQRACVFRIAVADIAAALPIMQVSDRLTDVAEIVLSSALNVAWRDVAGKHGRPRVDTSRGPRHAGFGVIAYGKFGGMELSYRSDLDLVFLHDGSGTELGTDGARPIDNGMFFGRLIRRLVHCLTVQTSSGALYQVDTRLRPSGRSGLLVTSVEAFERYQEENAWTWEHQALLRSRPVAGNAGVAREFERIRAETLRHRVRRERLLEDVTAMRARMRSQLDKSDPERFDLKQGVGGIGDIEFLVQYLVLRNAREHPAVIHFPDNIRQLGTLAAGGCLGEQEVAGLQDIYKSYRLRLHRLALDEQAPVVADSEFRDERRFVSELWTRVMQPPEKGHCP